MDTGAIFIALTLALLTGLCFGLVIGENLTKRRFKADNDNLRKQLAKASANDHRDARGRYARAL